VVPRLPLWIEFVDADAWDRAPEIESLLYSVMYAEFGVPLDGPWRDPASGAVTVIALADGGDLLGTVRLLPGDGDGRRQVRQLAVAPSARHCGVGAALMAAAEMRAAEEGCSAIWLHARDTAIAFYERLGYATIGETFVSELTGIPHRTMEKRLALPT
jgi:ribosomal protein S18 acetylase RimI-like enzyme